MHCHVPDGSCTAMWTLANAEGTFLQKAIAVEASYNGRYHSGDKLISAMGTLPAVTTKSIFGDKHLYGAEDMLY